MMKGLKLSILLIAEAVCLVVFVAMCNNTVTLQSIVPASRYQRNPTEENRIATEQAKRDEQRFLWTMRICLGLALFWNTRAIMKVAQRNTKRAANQQVQPIAGKPGSG